MQRIRKGLFLMESQGPTRQGQLYRFHWHAVLKNRDTVYQNVTNAGRLLQWVFVSRVIRDGCGIEDYYIGEVAFFQNTAIFQSESFCRSS